MSNHYIKWRCRAILEQLFGHGTLRLRLPRRGVDEPPRCSTPP